MDAFISKSDGVGALLSKITEFGQIDPASPTLFALENDAFIEAVNRWVTHPRKALSCPAVRIWDITIKTLARPRSQTR